MVDAVSTGTVSAPDPRIMVPARAGPVAQAAPVAPTQDASAKTASQSAAPQLAALAKAMASSAPVDTDRVAQIKQAIENGTFPILPATIADQMMALRYDWMSHDQA